MPLLLFLTGAPGSGKSTLAGLLAEERPLALALDLDALRGWLGGWRDDPEAAGARARELALELAATQLRLGGDVVVPQFVRRPELIRAFQELAAQTRSRFVLVALVSSAAEAASRFAARSGSPDPRHRDAAHLQSLRGAVPVERLYEEMTAMLAGIPETRFVRSLPGDIPGTLAAVREAIDLDVS